MKSFLRSVGAAPEPEAAATPEPTAPEPVDALGALYEERAAAHARLSRLGVFSEAAAEARGRLDLAREARNALLEVERERTRLWGEAGDPCAPPPVADTAKLRASREAVQDAEDALADAVNREEAMSGHVAEARRELSAIGLRIDELRSARVADEALALVPKLLETLDSARLQLASIIAAREALYLHAEQHGAAGKLQLRGIWASAAGRLAEIQTTLQVRPTQADLTPHRAAWSAKIEGDEKC